MQKRTIFWVNRGFRFANKFGSKSVGDDFSAKEREGGGVRPPPECVLRQVTALLSPAPMRLRMVCMGWGVWMGGGAGRERELSDRHCRPDAAGGTAGKPQHISRLKKGGLQQLR